MNKLNALTISYIARRALFVVIFAALLVACGRRTPAPTPTIQASATTLFTTTLAPSDTLESVISPVITSDRPRLASPTGEVTVIEEEPTEQPTPEDTATRQPEYIFEVDEFGYPLYPVDENGIQYYPTDSAGNPIIATDEIGYPVFPYDEEGMPIIPVDRNGNPLYEVDEFGNPIVPEPTFVDEEFFEEEPDAETATVRPGNPVRTTPSPRPGLQRSAVSDPGENNEPSVPNVTPTPIIWATPATTRPLGDPQNPLVMAVLAAPGDDVAVEAMTSLVERIAKDTGLSIKVQPVSSSAQLLNGLRANAVHLAWLQPFTYIIAEQRGYATVGLVTNHFGVTAYGVMFLASDLSGFEPFFNPASGKSTGTAEEALAQFDGLRPCYVDPLSASGYVVPEGLLQSSNVTRQSPVFVQSHTAVVRALYVQGICDFGATFAISGDPRTASIIQTDLSDAMTRVPVIWQSEAVIPNLNLSIHTKVPEATRLDLIDAFLDLAQNDEGRDMLTFATAYEIHGLVKVDDTFYDQLRKYQNLSGVNIRNLIGK